MGMRIRSLTPALLALAAGTAALGAVVEMGIGAPAAGVAHPSALPVAAAEGSSAADDAPPSVAEIRTGYDAMNGAAAADTNGASDPDGRAVYVARCAACHMPTGDGIAGAFPPLAGSEWVLGDERVLVRVVLHGLTGEIEVAGEPYAGLMPPLGSVLSDAEIAAVASYVRGSWGNEAGPVTEATVARERAATAGRATPWTAAELFAGLETVK